MMSFISKGVIQSALAQGVYVVIEGRYQMSIFLSSYELVCQDSDLSIH